MVEKHSRYTEHLNDTSAADIMRHTIDLFHAVESTQRDFV